MWNEILNGLRRLALAACSELYFIHEFRCRNRTGHRQACPWGVCGIGALVRRRAKPQMGPADRGRCPKRQVARTVRAAAIRQPGLIQVQALARLMVAMIWRRRSSVTCPRRVFNSVFVIK